MAFRVNFSTHNKGVITKIVLIGIQITGITKDYVLLRELCTQTVQCGTCKWSGQHKCHSRVILHLQTWHYEWIIYMDRPCKGHDFTYYTPQQYLFRELHLYGIYKSMQKKSKLHTNIFMASVLYLVFKLSSESNFSSSGKKQDVLRKVLFNGLAVNKCWCNPYG